ncbi:hypothetical protein [Cellulosimicrobium cellulans]|uniref:hypothetical protein n=1 Tax=Cellulosimicrobium cellulans TaxID=1710 RepID=UPI001651B8BF|nr:hypothetical protein [Cellulosimicrobium cellulans]
MKRNRMVSTGLGLVLAATGALGLAACGSDGGGSGGGASDAAEQDVDVAEDLENARQAVLEALEDDDWDQVMLASDVSAPTVKYGLLVMPYTYSDAASRVQGTIAVSDGKFTIEADSAETERTWQIDQDGSITEVTG